MEDIYTLLNINKGFLQDFHVLAKHAVDHQTELAINRCVRKLKETEERMMTDKGIYAAPQTIDEIIIKVIENAEENNKDMSCWSTHELRIISYYLLKLQGHEDAYKYALTLLGNNWRDLFFNGLSFYCLDSWNMIDPQLRILTCKLVIQKLQLYNGHNRKYMQMKNHANFFDEAGPLRLSALLSQKKQSVLDAPTYFYNKPGTINQSYYSDVIIHYFESNKITDLDYVETVLTIHKNDRTKKLLFANLVLRLHDYGDDIIRTQLCKFANRILGDITLASTWAPFPGATESEAQKLKKAKQFVNLWFNQKIIETFFEVCVPDRARKEFWLNYVGYVSRFKIAGSTATKKLLQGDSRVSEIFLPHFIETDSYTSQTSALILFIKNKMIVEFSDTGALYVYNLDHNKVKLVTQRRRILNTADLKLTSMSSLIQINDWGYKTYYEEGRMTHQGYWQDRLSGWLQQIVISSNNENLTFLDEEDNDIFKANPIPKKEFQPQSKPHQTTLPKQTEKEKQAQAQPFNLKQSKLSICRSAEDSSPEAIISLKEPVYQPGKQSSTKIQEQQNTPKLVEVPKIKMETTYETNINYYMASKWIADDRCRVVCGRKGFYIYIVRGRQFVFIHPCIKGTLPYGIWIRKPDKNGWREVSYATKKTETPIGYIKEAGTHLLYKRMLDQTDFMTIKI